MDFGHRIRGEGIVVRLSIQAVTHSRTCTTSSTFPLLRARSADPELLQTLHLGLGIKTHLLYFSYKNTQQKNLSVWLFWCYFPWVTISVSLKRSKFSMQFWFLSPSYKCTTSFIPESATKRTPSMVTEVSAILVEMMHFLTPGGAMSNTWKYKN